MLIKDEEGKEMILSYLNQVILLVNWACLKKAVNAALGTCENRM